MIEFLINFPSKAPYDTALLVITAIYAVVAWRVLAAADDRDHSFAVRMDRWHEKLKEAARERERKRPSPAE